MYICFFAVTIPLAMSWTFTPNNLYFNVADLTTQFTY